MPDQSVKTDSPAPQTPQAGAQTTTPPVEESGQSTPSAPPKVPPAAPAPPTSVDQTKPEVKPKEQTPPPTAAPPVAPEPEEKPASANPAASNSPSGSSNPSPPTPEEKVGEEVPPEKRNARLFTAGIVLALVLLGSTGAFFYLKSTSTTEEAVLAGKTEEVEEEVVSTPTPASLPREEISLEVFNASGVAGAAGSTAEELEELGYQIAEVGNADDITGNELYVNPEFEGLLDQLFEDVEEMLDIASVTGELTNSTATARIVLGR